MTLSIEDMNHSDGCIGTEHESNTCYLKYGKQALQQNGKCIGCGKTPEEILKEQTIESLEWMVTQYKWQYDNERDAMEDEGSQGGYSFHLTKAINLLNRLKKQE